MINNPIKSLEFDKEYTLTPQYVEPDLSLSEGKILLGEFDESQDNIMSIRTNDTLNYVDNTLFTPNLSVDNTVTVGTIKNSDKEYVISDNDNNMILKVDSNGLETTKIRATEFEGDVNGTASNADKLKLVNGVGSGEKKLSICATTSRQSVEYGDVYKIPKIYLNDDSSFFVIDYETLINSAVEINANLRVAEGNITCDDNISAEGTISATSGFIGNLTGNVTGSATTATNLASAPSLAASGTSQIKVTAGGKTSAAFTVPYATKADSANSALNAENATNASNATNAEHATSADTATSAGTANTAITATNLASAPSLAASGTSQIKVTAGGKTSAAFTVPYATKAASANNVMINNSDTNDALPILLTTWNNGTASSRAVYMDSTKSFYYNPSTNNVITTGTMTATNGFYETSDERLKEIIRPVHVDLEKLSKLRKVYFTWKDNPRFGSHKNIGMIAQDVKELYPELITEQNGQLSLAYDKLSVITLEAIDILYKENKELKDQVNKLENKCFDLEEKFIDLEVLVKKIIKTIN